MKKLILFIAISLVAFTTKAQNMDFDQTVKYIKERVENKLCFTVQSNCFTIKEISFTKLGETTMSSPNQEDIVSFNLLKLSKTDDGITYHTKLDVAFRKMNVLTIL